jgi:hypothetical protein
MASFEARGRDSGLRFQSAFERIEQAEDQDEWRDKNDETDENG